MDNLNIFSRGPPMFLIRLPVYLYPLEPIITNSIRKRGKNGKNFY